MSLPIVSIIGRANVGKSTLFNRLAQKRHAIVSNLAHTTRDPLYALVNFGKRDFLLVDTAGLSTSKDTITLQAMDQLEQIKDLSSLIIIMLDGTTLVSDEDRKVVKKALKTKKPVILLVNKSDKKNLSQDKNIYLKLGIKDILFVSAINGEGADKLLQKINKKIPQAKKTVKKNIISVAIIGKPNVGKSSLINSLSGKKISIVSDVAGTTRDLSYIDIETNLGPLKLIDTAGLRKKSKAAIDEIEYYSSIRVLQAIDEADICLLMLDANEQISHQDQNIAGIIKDSSKGLVIVANKADLIDESQKNYFLSKATREFKFLPWSPLVFISSKTKLNLDKLTELIFAIHKKQNLKIPTTKLNRLLEDATSYKPPTGVRSVKPKLNYITQTKTNPPQFSIFCSNPDFIHFSYKRYLENMIRKEYDLDGVNIKIIFKKKN